MANGDPIIIGQSNSGSHPSAFDPTVLQDSTLFLTSQEALPLHAYSHRTYGVLAESGASDAVSAGSGNGNGVTGFSSAGNGLHGSSFSATGYGVVGNGSGWGGYFTSLVVGGLTVCHTDFRVGGNTWIGDTDINGALYITGTLAVFGLKLAAVPHPDGSYRGLYCLESPESWFEDFGRAQTVSLVS